MSQKAAHPSTKLLIVDDDPAIRTLLARLAASWGYEAETSASAEDALVSLKSKKYNVIISDIKMHGMDGLVFAKCVREAMPAVAVIIITGYPSPKTAKLSQEMGIIYYLPKPIEAEMLAQTLRIAATWNLGKLVNQAVRRFIALKESDKTEPPHNEKAIKSKILRLIASGDWVGDLLDFVYAGKAESTRLYKELQSHFTHSIP